jgi:hypothetical protein
MLIYIPNEIRNMIVRCHTFGSAAEFTLNIPAVMGLVPDLIGTWNKILKMFFLFHSLHT